MSDKFVCATCGISEEDMTDDFLNDKLTKEEMDHDYVLFSTHCPKCNVLKKKLEAANIDFIESEKIQILLDNGFSTAPVLYDTILDVFYEFSDAVKLINSIQ